jgi:type I restriction enzyme M protein
MVEVTKPKAGELIQDPAAGTAGFLIAADRYIKRYTDSLKTLSSAQAKYQRERAFVGIELVAETQKLALMNATLHGIYGPILHGDALGEAGESLPKADVILTNPPFGSKSGAGLPMRSFPIPTTNKQLAFLQHIYLGLLPEGRAAVVMPDLGGTTAAKVCGDLMDKCDVHTVLRLPTGIFYAHGVKTNVLYFTRGEKQTKNTKETWIYDLRSNMPQFGKRTPLTRAHFADFEETFGSDPYGKSKRKDQGDDGRFRCFSRDFIRQHGDNFDITWLVDNQANNSKTNKSPDVLVNEIVNRLQFALDELKALQAEGN